jgi:hypothetical protein
MFKWVADAVDGFVSAGETKATEDHDTIGWEVVAMRIRVHAALLFAWHHGESQITAELLDCIKLQADSRVDGAGFLSKPERIRLKSELRKARLGSLDDDDFGALIQNLAEHEGTLSREWIADLISALLELAKVHGTTKQCLRFLRDFAACMGYRVKKKRTPASKSKRRGKTTITDYLGFYAILEVAHDADMLTLKLAYRRRALEVHPDRFKGRNATKLFQELNCAYEVLSDPARRAQYDSGHFED